MSVNLFRRKIVINDLIKLHKIYARQFAALAKYYKKDEALLNQSGRIHPCDIHPCNRRDFIGFVPDRKDGYKTQKELTEKEHVRLGLKQLKTELKLWTEEIKEELRSDPMLIAPHGEVDTVFEFGKQEDIDKFVATSDSDHNEGYSHCSLKISPAGYGLFSGVLDSTVPKQGKISRAGYCNITSQRVRV